MKQMLLAILRGRCLILPRCSVSRPQKGALRSNVVLRLAMLLLILVAGADAAASPFYSGTIHGVFSHPVLAGTLLDLARRPVFLDNSKTAVSSIVNGPSTAEVISGDNNGGYGAPSTIIFTGSTFRNVAPGQEFNLGTVAYFNGTSTLSSLLFGATLTLSVLEDPSISALTTQMGIVTTANGGFSPVLDADYLRFPPLSLAFHVYEGAGATGILRGSILGDPQLVLTNIVLAPGQTNGFLATVPEPSPLLLLAAGGLALGIALRRSFAR